VVPARDRGAVFRTLKRDFVVVALDRGLCGDGVANVRIPKSEVLGIATDR
jgi:hypothetical protein